MVNFGERNSNLKNNESKNDNANKEEKSNVDMDIFKRVNEYKEKLKATKEVKELTNEIEIQNTNSIVMFGQKASENISQVSDELLNSMRTVDVEEAGEMLGYLTKIMDRFDLEEFENINQEATRPSKGPSRLARFFKSSTTTVTKLFQKYDDMGGEVEKIYVLLKQYENDIKGSNDHLKRLYNGNIQFYQLLERYIVAGELALEEIENYEKKLQSDDEVGFEEKQMITQKLAVSKEMLSQRINDLKISENVAIQAAPMIQMIQMSNFNLMRKINSSFIVTLPIFKQYLAQAIILKRQEVQAKSIKQLDDKTNEFIIKNAQNTAMQSIEIAKMASGSSITIEALEQSYDTIMNGIEETKNIQEGNKNQRIEYSKKLELIKMNMKKNISKI